MCAVACVQKPVIETKKVSDANQMLLLLQL